MGRDALRLGLFESHHPICCSDLIMPEVHSFLLLQQAVGCGVVHVWVGESCSVLGLSAACALCALRIKCAEQPLARVDCAEHCLARVPFFRTVWSCGGPR
jgi:predicted ferric reductase